MESQIVEQNGNDVPAAEIPFGVKKCGWVFRFIQEGWLKKRWRKRWCFLKHEALYIFENETFEDSDEHKCELKLEQYEQCIAASKKDSKKKYTFVLLPEKRQQNSNKKEVKKKVNKEMMYAEDDAEMQSWIKAISETISFAHLDAAGKEKALAPQRLKANLKPKGKKPPTRQHRRKRAAESQMLLESTTQSDTPQPEPQKRQNEGKRPASALMPKKARKLSENKSIDSVLSSSGSLEPSADPDATSEANGAIDVEEKLSTESLSACLQNTLHFHDDNTTDVSSTPTDQGDENTDVSEKTQMRQKEPPKLPIKPRKSSHSDHLDPCDMPPKSDKSSSDFQSSESLKMDVDEINDETTDNTLSDDKDISNNTDVKNTKNENSNCNSGLIVEILEDVGFIRTEL